MNLLELLAVVGGVFVHGRLRHRDDSHPVWKRESSGLMRGERGKAPDDRERGEKFAHHSLLGAAHEVSGVCIFVLVFWCLLPLPVSNAWPTAYCVRGSFAPSAAASCAHCCNWALNASGDAPYVPLANCVVRLENKTLTITAMIGSRTAENAAVGGQTTPSTAVMIVAKSVDGSMALACGSSSAVCALRIRVRCCRPARANASRMCR